MKEGRNEIGVGKKTKKDGHTWKEKRRKERRMELGKKNRKEGRIKEINVERMKKNKTIMMERLKESRKREERKEERGREEEGREWREGRREGGRSKVLEVEEEGKK